MVTVLMIEDHKNGIYSNDDRSANDLNDDSPFINKFHILIFTKFRIFHVNVYRSETKGFQFLWLKDFGKQVHL